MDSSQQLLLSKLLVCVFAQVAFCQLNVDVVKSQVFTGLKSPRVVESAVLFELEGSKPVLSPAALITISSNYKFIRVKARQSLFEYGALAKISATEYLLVGTGKYALEVTAFDPELGIDEKIILITLGDAPPPIPDPDVPTPPGPSPIPDDEFGNLARKISDLSKNLPKRKEVALLYEEAAKSLTENPASTINSVVQVLTDKRKTVLGTDSAKWDALVTKLNEELKTHWPMPRADFARFLQLISLGLGS